MTTIQSFSATLVQTNTNGEVVITPNRRGDPQNNSSKTAFEAALAQLVTDGASPTQTHVTTANNAYTAYKVYLTNLGDDVSLLFNATNVTSRSALRAILTKLLRQVEGSGILTP